MKRMGFNIVIAAVIAVAAFSFADAQGDGQRRPGPGGGPGFGRGPGGPGGPGSIARLADLTEEQRTQVRAIVEEDRASRQGPPAAMLLQRQLGAAILADAPDDQQIDTLRQQIAQAQSDELSRQIALQRKIAQVLTPEQRATARTRLSEDPPARGRRGEGHKPQAF